ncbi:MAG TPA: hypothetical protein PJ988_18185 [Anaerolinea sp.]|nr:hypothetical protein [Anaerolinea sp.]
MNSTVTGLIIGIILVIITLVLIFWGRGKEVERADIVRRSEMAAAPEARPVVVASAPAVADDLTLIEGIGPKIAGLLHQKGITTFAQLAAAELPMLEQMLKENGMQFTKPASWMGQARLAAEGKMDELKALQEKLVAGR